MGRCRLTDHEKQQKEARKKEFVPADPRCKECDYWRYLGGVDDEQLWCCHYALLEGRLRNQISRTECGSFVDKQTAPKRKMSFQDVPMTQWGTGGLATVRRGQR